MTDLEKLRVLLPHWIEHNRSHGADFGNWAALARIADAEEVAGLIDQAREYLEKADSALTEALGKLGGRIEHLGDHHHHHHHD